MPHLKTYVIWKVKSLSLLGKGAKVTKALTIKRPEVQKLVKLVNHHFLREVLGILNAGCLSALGLILLTQEEERVKCKASMKSKSTKVALNRQLNNGNSELYVSHRSLHHLLQWKKNATVP